MIIAFTVNDRPRYLQQTLESWSKVRGIGDATLIFRCEPGCAETVALCESVDFARHHVVRNDSRFGVLENPWLAFRSAFAVQTFRSAVASQDPGVNPFTVLAEDDLVVSPDVLEYFTWCQRYRDDPEVLGVTTYQHHEQPGGLAAAAPADWSRDDEWHFWVWGTWRDRWENLLRDSWDFTYEENGGGPGQRGWDWKIRNLYVMRSGLKMIAPALARSQHIGRYGGSHATPAQFPGLLSKCFAGPDVAPQGYEEGQWLTTRGSS